ncbi:hypothetical protein KIPB_002252, partial [Kipferlia bialata]
TPVPCAEGGVTPDTLLSALPIPLPPPMATDSEDEDSEGGGEGMVPEGLALRMEFYAGDPLVSVDPDTPLGFLCALSQSSLDTVHLTVHYVPTVGEAGEGEGEEGEDVSPLALGIAAPTTHTLAQFSGVASYDASTPCPLCLPSCVHCDTFTNVLSRDLSTLYCIDNARQDVMQAVPLSSSPSLTSTNWLVASAEGARLWVVAVSLDGEVKVHAVSTDCAWIDAAVTIAPQAQTVLKAGTVCGVTRNVSTNHVWLSVSEPVKPKADEDDQHVSHILCLSFNSGHPSLNVLCTLPTPFTLTGGLQHFSVCGTEVLLASGTTRLVLDTKTGHGRPLSLADDHLSLPISLSPHGTLLSDSGMLHLVCPSGTTVVVARGVAQYAVHGGTLFWVGTDTHMRRTELSCLDSVPQLPSTSATMEVDTRLHDIPALVPPSSAEGWSLVCPTSSTDCLYMVLGEGEAGESVSVCVEHRHISGQTLDVRGACAAECKVEGTRSMEGCGVYVGGTVYARVGGRLISVQVVPASTDAAPLSVCDHGLSLTSQPRLTPDRTGLLLDTPSGMRILHLPHGSLPPKVGPSHVARRQCGCVCAQKVDECMADTQDVEPEASPAAEGGDAYTYVGRYLGQTDILLNGVVRGPFGWALVKRGVVVPFVESVPSGQQTPSAHTQAQDGVERERLDSARLAAQAIQTGKSQRLHFVGVDLAGTLAHLSFRHCLFEGCTITGCEQSRFRDCVWSDCTFVACNFKRCDMGACLMEGCDLSHSNMNQAVVVDTSMDRCRLDRSYWDEGCRVSGLSLSHTSLSSTTVSTFQGWRFKEWDTFSETYLGPGCNLAGLVLRTKNGVSYEYCPLTGRDLKGSSLRGADVTGIDLTGCNLEDCDLTGAVCLTPIHLVQAASIAGCTLSADVEGWDLKGVDMQRCDLSATSGLTCTHLRESGGCQGVVLKYLTLKGDLSHTDLTGADLSGANLSGCDLTGATLTGCNLEGTNITACTMEDSTLPADISMAVQNPLSFTFTKVTTSKVVLNEALDTAEAYHEWRETAVKGSNTIRNTNGRVNVVVPPVEGAEFTLTGSFNNSSNQWKANTRFHYPTVMFPSTGHHADATDKEDLVLKGTRRGGVISISNPKGEDVEVPCKRGQDCVIRLFLKHGNFSIRVGH